MQTILIGMDELPMPVDLHAERKSYAPVKSTMFDRVIPALLILMGILTALLILFAAGVLLGIVHF